MQDLVTWAREYGRGAYTYLHRDSGVAYRTVIKAAREGLPVTHTIAERLSRATKRAVSAAAIRRGVQTVDPS